MNIEQMNRTGTIENWLDLKDFITKYLNEKYPLTQDDMKSVIMGEPSEAAMKRKEAQELLEKTMKEIIDAAREENREIVQEYANGNFARRAYTVKDYQEELTKQKEKLIETLLATEEIIEVPEDVENQKQEDENQKLKPSEVQEQILKDEEGNRIGERTISWYTIEEEKLDRIETVGRVENDDGIYDLKEVSEERNGRLQNQIKKIDCYNKVTGQEEEYIYRKDNQGNEYYCKTADGLKSFMIQKTIKGTIIDTFNDDGENAARYEYDQHGKGIIPMTGVDELEKNYVENFFELDMPYFEVEDVEKEDEKVKFLKDSVKYTENIIRKETMNEQAQIIEFFRKNKEKSDNEQANEENIK